LYNLPGGPILKTESVDQAAARLLTEERTQIKYLYLNQFKVFGVTNRIISSLHRELIIEEVLEKYEKMKWTRLQADSYVSDIMH
jgi:8-oxo-dGTP diphosphatase